MLAPPEASGDAPGSSRSAPVLRYGAKAAAWSLLLRKMKEKREEQSGAELLRGTVPTFRVVLSSEGRGPVLGETGKVVLGGWCLTAHEGMFSTEVSGRWMGRRHGDREVWCV